MNSLGDEKLGLNGIGADPGECRFQSNLWTLSLFKIQRGVDPLGMLNGGWNACLNSSKVSRDPLKENPGVCSCWSSSRAKFGVLEKVF